MNSQKIQAFNGQFTPYEGTKKGSEIKSLISTVNASNATDDAHKVTVYGPVQNAGAISSSATFTVEVHYNGNADIAKSTYTMAGSGTIVSEAGYIDYINIK